MSQTSLQNNHKWWIFVAMVIAVVMSNVELTAMNLALAAMGKELRLSLRVMQWILNAYLLSYASFIVAGGKLADLYGRRKVFIIGVVIFLLASLLGGFAQNATELLIARFWQGFGTAIGVALTTVITYTAFPEKQRSMALGLLTGFVGFGLAVGPTLGGILTDTLGWRWIFFINIPFGILAIIITALFTPKDIPPKKIPFDYGGVVLLTLALCGIIFAINQTEEWQWHSPLLIVIFATAFCLLLAFYQRERHHPHALIAVDILHNKKFLVGCLTRFLSMYAFYVPLFIVSLYMQNVIGYTPSQAGIIFLAMTISIAVLSPLGGLAVNKFGGRITVTVSTLLLALSFYALAQLQPDSDTQTIVFCLFLLGIAYGIFSPSLLRATMKNVADEKLGVAAGAFYMMSVTGGVISIAVAGSILNAFGLKNLLLLAKQHHVHLTRIQANDVMQQLFSSHSQNTRLVYRILRLHPDVATLSHQAFMIAFTRVMHIGMIMTLMASLLVFLGLKNGIKKSVN